MFLVWENTGLNKRISLSILLKMKQLIIFVVLLLLVSLNLTNSCYLWGTDSGECSTDSQNSLWRQANMPFCADKVVYAACIPSYEVSR